MIKLPFESQKLIEICRKNDVTRIGIFGSFARGEATDRSGVDEKTFLSNTLIQDAVIRQLEVIGETPKRLSAKLRQMNAEIPWQDVAGMRDKLIHGYFGVETPQVWLTVWILV